MYTDINGLTYDELRASAPSVMGTQRHPEKTTERFLFVNSMDIIDKLGDNGFIPVSAGQSRARLENQYYTSHVIRFRHEDDLGSDKDEVIEYVMRNGHGAPGNRKFDLRLGVFVTVCSNGLTVGKTLQSFTMKHIGNMSEEALNAIHNLMGMSGRVTGIIEEMKSTQISYQQQVLLADKALSLRYPHGSPFTGELINVPQLDADYGNSVWNAYQRAQYALTRGGIRVNDQETGRTRSLRRLTSVTNDATINDALFDLYESALH